MSCLNRIFIRETEWPNLRIYFSVIQKAIIEEQIQHIDLCMSTWDDNICVLLGNHHRLCKVESFLVEDKPDDGNEYE